MKASPDDIRYAAYRRYCEAIGSDPLPQSAWMITSSDLKIPESNYSFPPARRTLYI